MGEISNCGPGSISIGAEIQNHGTESVDGFTVKLMNGSEEIASETYPLTLGVYDRTTINFGNFELDETTNITVQLSESDNLSSDNQINQEISIGTVQQQAIVRVSTDNFGQDCRWRIRNENNQIVASGGPYANHANTSTFELQVQDP